MLPWYQLSLLCSTFHPCQVLLRQNLHFVQPQPFDFVIVVSEVLVIETSWSTGLVSQEGLDPVVQKPVTRRFWGLRCVYDLPQKWHWSCQFCFSKLFALGFLKFARLNPRKKKKKNNRKKKKQITRKAKPGFPLLLIVSCCFNWFPAGLFLHISPHVHHLPADWLTLRLVGDLNASRRLAFKGSAAPRALGVQRPKLSEAKSLRW